jgi:hypothetical protein
VVAEFCCEGGALLLVLGEDTVGDDDAIISGALCQWIGGKLGYQRMTIPWYSIYQNPRERFVV